MSFRENSPFRHPDGGQLYGGPSPTAHLVDRWADEAFNSPTVTVRGSDSAVGPTSAGVQKTDKGIEVTDGSAVRVILGSLGGSSYGLKVIAADGSTVVIDGTSDVFKIAATGTHSVVSNTGTSTSDSQTITGLGAWPGTPACLGFISSSNANNANRHLSVLGDVQTLGGLWASTSAGIATNALFLALKTFVEVHASLDGSSNAVVTMTQHNQSGSNFTFFDRYYLLQETAI